MSEENNKNFKHPKPEFFVAKEFLAPDESFMIRITGRTGKYTAYSWELVRPKKIPSLATDPKLETARFFQVYTSTVLGVSRITNPMNRGALADLIAVAEFWILEQVQQAEDTRAQARIDAETAKASRGQQAPRAGLKTLAKQDREERARRGQ